MGNITSAVHYHHCPKCNADWPHPGYECRHDGVYACIKCGGAEPGNSTSAKEAVAEMAQKLKDLHDPTKQIAKMRQALARQGLVWCP
jgi:uncharacterized Zn finger protein (UPF0148 family)